MRAPAARSGGAAGVSHDRPRAQTFTFERPGLQKHHQNSTRRHPEREEKNELVQCAGGWLGLGSGAWHPLDPSWVPLPVLRGRLNILEARGQGLGIP